MAGLWEGAAADPAVSEVISAGGRLEAWVKGSNAWPPRGMRATDRDATIGEAFATSNEAFTTAIERPQEGGTLLATQRWRRADGRWILEAHRYVPWDASGATAVAALRCDCRGCTLLVRDINTRAR